MARVWVGLWIVLGLCLGVPGSAQAETCPDVADYLTITRCLARGGSPAPSEEAQPMPATPFEFDPCLLVIEQEVLLSPEPKPEWRPAVRTVYFVDRYLGEVQNGGIHQFFFNPSGDYAEAVVAALQEIGVPAQAALLQEAIDLFPPPYPADIDTRRRIYFSGSEPSDLEDRLDALTDRFDDGAIGEAEYAFAEREKTRPYCPERD